MNAVTNATCVHFLQRLLPTQRLVACLSSTHWCNILLILSKKQPTDEQQRQTLNYFNTRIGEIVANSNESVGYCTDYVPITQSVAQAEFDALKANGVTPAWRQEQTTIIYVSAEQLEKKRLPRLENGDPSQKLRMCKSALITTLANTVNKSAPDLLPKPSDPDALLYKPEIALNTFEGADD